MIVESAWLAAVESLLVGLVAWRTAAVVVRTRAETAAETARAQAASLRAAKRRALENLVGWRVDRPGKHRPARVGRPGRRDEWAR